ncbi:hypothetical protein [Rhodococcus zopfii]|uniref:hypothetical protein n=1 Tax=Rhodococcus zopfii TaxID=43772 RepID=UPI001EDC97E7|nr:hypothetical protein [Rhodococcus zopfii]
MPEVNEDPIPAPVDIGKLAINMRVTADALESAEILVEFAIPKFEPTRVSGRSYAGDISGWGVDG